MGKRRNWRLIAWICRYTSLTPKDVLELHMDDLAIFVETLEEIIKAESGEKS